MSKEIFTEMIGLIENLSLRVQELERKVFGLTDGVELVSAQTRQESGESESE